MRQRVYRAGVCIKQLLKSQEMQFNVLHRVIKNYRRFISCRRNLSLFDLFESSWTCSFLWASCQSPDKQTVSRSVLMDCSWVFIFSTAFQKLHTLSSCLSPCWHERPAHFLPVCSLYSGLLLLVYWCHNVISYTTALLEFASAALK